MANLKVSLLRQCKTENGWRRYPAVVGKNGRVKPNYVIVAGEEKEFKTGYYQLRTYSGTRTIIKSVGARADEALVALNKEVRLMMARETASQAGVQIMEEPERPTLARQLTQFIRTVNDRGAEVAASVYRLAADDFLAVTGRMYANQVTHDDILQYHNSLRKRGSTARTVYNRHRNLLSFLRYCGVDISKMGKVPKYEKTLPEIYSDEQLKRFFASLKEDRHKILFETLLSTGLREQEAMYLEWPDISLQTATLTIHSKPKYGFKIKDKEERSVPLSAGLLSKLKGGTGLVFPTRAGRPDTKMLRTLKRLVHRAGLNCGHCKSCRERNECDNWFLHKFRATYATKLLRSGMDIRSVQALLGHSDMASTLRYVRGAEHPELQAKVNAIAWV